MHIDFMIIANLPQAEACEQHINISKQLSDIDLEYDALIACGITGSAAYNRFANSLPFYQNIAKDGIELQG